MVLATRGEIAAYEFSIFSINPWGFRVKKNSGNSFHSTNVHITELLSIFNVPPFFSVLNQFFQNKWLNQKMVPDEWSPSKWMETWKAAHKRKALSLCGTEWCQFVSQSARKFDWKAYWSGKFPADASIAGNKTEKVENLRSVSRIILSQSNGRRFISFSVYFRQYNSSPVILRIHGR